MLKSLGCPRCLLRPSRTVKRVPHSKIHCSLKPTYQSSVVRKPSTTRALVLEAPAARSVNNVVALDFDRCFVNFDKLGDNDVVHCVNVAEEVLKEGGETNEGQDISGEEKSRAEWFKGYMSTAYGL